MLGLTKFARGRGNIELREWPEPEPGPGEVKIAIRAASVCGTDIHIHDDEYPVHPPVILGHEMSGQVAEVGGEVTRVAIGDRVTAHPFVGTCGHCSSCLQGVWGQCEERRAFGVEANGAFAPYLVVPESVVRRLPDNLDYESAALIESLACCVKAVLETGSVRAQ